MSNSQSLKGLTADATIGQIVSAEKNAGELLSSIGLSPNNHESETLRSVCQQKKWSEVEVLKWLKKNQQNNGAPKGVEDEEEPPDFGKNLQKWCKYLERHFLTRNTELLDDINRDFPRVHKIHGNQYNWLKNMHWYLDKLEEKLNYYFYFQRHKLFPLLEILKDSNKNVLHGTIKKVNNGIEIIEEDQSTILELIDTIEEKGQGLKNPECTCSTLRILNYNFRTLFSSLRKQIAIEREHLIPLVKQKLKSG
ncbi:Iron-sulfur cluster repair protein YtfE, RIC family, contains ScdAN and hemerythrin domains [Fodinibius roseus]|uniref:Iron-sulfur cluster repair protein YtfE, RIC family, contains ScdAN and hemerythrin domains n=1 Tax=Fodinibius roseus TaxID=1194090 RepID=A0A1M5K9B6_9BACT|nr:hypothetical protein [Fodinibius roseus]SHG49385.1 Iron-sulfur cluster repair protein YtfE, RIC family, contains ScdAN and hemerythrin domains [Fodinibius roseus]